MISLSSLVNSVQLDIHRSACNQAPQLTHTEHFALKQKAHLMPYNPKIPGQVNSYQLRAIEIVAGLVPENGKMVEVGSLFGASSWCWSKSVDPSATVFCIDPWEGNEGVRPIEKRLGITYGLDQFKKYTADCPNIVPKQGYSPRDFQDWDEPIDLYYEDAVHTDPILSQNLEFWVSHLKPDGIVCGDDYRNRFPDVRRGAERLSRSLGRELIRVENFWCLLPNRNGDTALDAARDALLALAHQYEREMRELGPHAKASLVPADRGLGLKAEVTLGGILPWPSKPSKKKLKLSLDVYSDQSCAELLSTQTVKTSLNQLIPDISAHALFGELDVGDKTSFFCKLTVSDGSGAKFEAAELGVELASGLVNRGKHLLSVNLKSREFFLKYSRNPESFGVKPLAQSMYELQRPFNDPITIRSTLSTHEIALCYALANECWNGDAIVDLGSMMGASTWAFAKGIADAGVSVEQPPIHSFDLWKSFEGNESYLQNFSTGGGGSVLGQWCRTVEGYHELAEPHQGDFLSFEWDGRPIGILFVDVAKSIALNNHVVSTMFSCLDVGSILIQQDYVHYNEYWIHLEMARLREYFEPCYTLRGASRFYTCIKKIPEDLCAVTSSDLSYQNQVALLEQERSLAPEPVREVLKSAAAKHAIENKDFDRAEKLLGSVNFEPLTKNGVQEFSGIAVSNHNAVRSLLEVEKARDS